MINNYMGLINLDENESNIIKLTRNRPIASIPIGGRYRIIDFVLSNLVNAGLINIGIFAKSNSRSLIDHLGQGKPWDLDRKNDGLFVFNFGINGDMNQDIRIFKNNLEYLYRSKQENVILTSSNMICNMDLKKSIANHEQAGSDVTVIYKKVNNADECFHDCNTLNIDSNNKVISVGKNLGVDKNNNISMEMFIMKKYFLTNLIFEIIRHGYYSSIKEVIYKKISDFNVNACEYKGYLACINSTKSYYEANMDMLDLDVTKDLFFKNGPIYTKIKDAPPTIYKKGSIVKNSRISNGCIIEGNVFNSVISRSVKINKNAYVSNSIILQGCEIKEGAHLENIILDKNNVIKLNSVLKGYEAEPYVLEKKGKVCF